MLSRALDIVRVLLVAAIVPSMLFAGYGLATNSQPPAIAMATLAATVVLLAVYVSLQAIAERR